jgi:hypothetical protein
MSAIMDKKAFLESLTNSLREVPDNAVVNLGEGEVVIPFARSGVVVAQIRISGTRTEGKYFPGAH